jgi:transposase-like protein
MRKNQRYSKEEMYLAVELWQESGLTQRKFCSLENLSIKTFGYWLRKYRKEKELSVGHSKNAPDAFIPIEVPGTKTLNGSNMVSGQIKLSFPNGVLMSCPVGIDIVQLKNLIKF